MITHKSKDVLQHHVGAKRERIYSPYPFLTSALDGGEWSASQPGRTLPTGKDLGTHWIGSWVGLRAALDTEARRKIPCSCWVSNHSCSGCSETAHIGKYMVQNFGGKYHGKKEA
jgi:hypothetical protein